LKKRGAAGGLALDISLWTVPIAIVGARIFHVLTHSADYFYPGADLIAVFRSWEGGIAIYGGLIGGAIGAWIGSKQAGIKFWSFADAVAPGILLAQAIGRWGNYFNQELFGQPTTLPWGLEIDSYNPAYPDGLPDGVLFHPTFLYESIWSLIGVAILLLLDRKLELRWGKMFAAYLIYYSIGRIWTENLRIDPSEILFGLRTNVWSALFGIAVGIAIIYWQTRQHKGPEASVYRANALDSNPR
jgi:prolipoprotein diacylglyceryl transferase